MGSAKALRNCRSGSVNRGRMVKTDPRVRYTRMIIQTAFLKLLQQKPANKIIVREICDKAEINQSTFYKHYQGCYNLLDHLKELESEKFTAKCNVKRKSDSSNCDIPLLSTQHPLRRGPRR